jgi:hypothetical protein|tara:strand:- start:120 stop:323 length:204 start_codon:yes stop_codon:yes gene_type:complete
MKIKGIGKILFIPDKNNQKNDLILLRDKKARSMRSITELINNLLKLNISDKDLDRVLAFIRKELMNT